MADIRVNQLPDRGEIAASDILHILNTTTTDDVDNQTTVDEVADWIIANKSVRITGIDDVPGLRAALDGKADIVHTHTVGQVIGLQADLDNKTDVSQAQIIGRNIILNGKSINVPSSIAGLQDDRIPDTVVVGEYLQFGTTGGGINNITGDDLKGNLNINLVDNTTDLNKPISTATQVGLDSKVDDSVYQTKQTAQDTNILNNNLLIQNNATAIAINTAKVSYPTSAATKLAGIETGADVTDTTNVWSSLGISSSGSTGQFLTQRGVFVSTPDAIITKSEVDRAIGSGSEGTDYYSSNKTWLPIPTGGGTGTVTKAVIDAAIGAFPTGDSAQFYNEQGNFVDAVYDSIEDAPIIRNRTIESIAISGTRSNVQIIVEGQNEMSTLTMLDSFDSSAPTFTSTFTSPNSQLVPAITLPAGSQGTQFSLTESDGTVHMFGYITNGNYRYLDAGLTGVVRKGTAQEATTATTTGTFTIADQGLAQSLTLAGDERGTFAAGDFISRSDLVAQAFRGMFIESVSFIGGNTLLVGSGGGGTTFDTTNTIYRAGPANEIQGTVAAFSYDPDTSDTVYSTAVTNQAFTTLGTGITENITEVANAITGLESGITWDGIITQTGLPGAAIGTNPTRYEATISFGASWAVFSSADLADFVEFGVDDSVADFSNMFIGGNRFDATTSPGDFIRLTVGNSSAYFTVGAVTTVGTKDFTALGEAVGAVGTLGRTLIDGDNSAVLSVFSAEAASSVTIDLGTENNIDSSFTITGGLNNMETVVNDDGILGNISPATTITVIDPEATEVASFTASVSNTTDDNVDVIANQIVTAVNNNTETPIDFTAAYDALSQIITLTAERAGNTNFWSIIINNNGATVENAGNLSTSSTQSGELVNELQTAIITGINDSDTNIEFDGADRIYINANDTQFAEFNGDTSQIRFNANTFIVEAPTTFALARSITPSDLPIIVQEGETIFNFSNIDHDFFIRKNTSGTALSYDAGTDTLTADFPATTVVGFGGGGGGADGLSITDTVNLNLLDGTTVLSTVTLPSSSGTTIIAGTANQIVNTVSGDTNTLSLSPVITDAIGANTNKVGVNNLSFVAGALEASDSVAYLDGTTPRRKPFSDIPLSIMNNDSGFITGITKANVDTAIGDGANDTDYYASDKTWKALPSGGTATTVLGTNNQINVATVGNTATVSLDSQVTGAISTNTSNISFNATGIANNASDITNIEAKTDFITVTQAVNLDTIETATTTNATNIATNTTNIATNVTAIALNTAKTGITTEQATAITTNETNIATNATAIDTKGDGLSITDTTTLNLLEGTNVLDSVTLPSGGGTSDYDDLTNAPITRIRQVDEFILSGTRTNVQPVIGATNEFSTITMFDSFNPTATFGSIDTSADVTYSQSISNEGDWNFSASISFSGGLLIPNGSAWSTLNNRFFLDSTTGGHPGIFSQVNVGDALRITIGSGSATFTASSVDEFINIGAVTLTNARDTVGTINGINSNNASIGITIEDAGTGVAAGTFAYDPDTSNAVYSTSVPTTDFTLQGTGIQTHLTQVANAITALNANITWDGAFTVPTATRTVTSGSTTYVNTNLPSINEYSFTTSAGVVIPITSGDAWTELVDARIAENRNTPNGLYDNVRVGDLVKFTFGAGNATFEVTDIGPNNTAHYFAISNIQDVVGTIGRTFTPGETFALEAEITRPDRTSITIDLGTNNNIGSSYTVSGGTNNEESLVNTNPADIVEGIATTITITDGNSNQVTSFTSSVPLTTDENIDVVGQQIADAITANTETPIDFQGFYDDTTKVVTVRAVTAGQHDSWSITINNNSTTTAREGDLTISAALEVDEVANQIDIISFPDGTSQTTAVSTTVAGTTDQVDVTVLGGVSTISLATEITDAIATNTAKTGISTTQSSNIVTNNAKQSVAGLNQVGAAVLSTDSVVYYAGAALAPRIKVFSSVPLSVFNNDAVFPVLSDNQTFTGVNTFNNTSSTGSIQTRRIAGIGNTGTYINFDSNTLFGTGVNAIIEGSTTTTLRASSSNTIMQGTTTSTIFNSNRVDRDFVINKNASGEVIAYDAGTDTLTFDATTINGLPSGSGDAVLADNQTFTGVNTFTNTAGGIKADRITVLNDILSYIELRFTDNISLVAGGDRLVTCNHTDGTNENAVRINNSFQDTDFIIRKETSGEAYRYDGGTDTHTFTGNVVGVADSETGTWTPTFANGGTQGAIVATYSKAGNIVTLNVIATVGVSTSTGFYTVSEASLPFTLANTTVTPTGTFLIGNDLAGFASISSGFALVFIKPDRSIVTGTEVSGQTAFTLTYETND